MKIYLAGPDVFLPNASEVLNNKKKICQDFGFTGISPLDGESNHYEINGLDIAKRIFINNKSLIQECYLLVADCNPFRGPLVDDGTAWEIGFARGVNKKVFGYIDEYIPLVESTSQRIPTQPHESGYLVDHDGYLLNEDFGNAINLMLEFSIEESGGELIEGKFLDCIQVVYNSIMK